MSKNVAKVLLAAMDVSTAKRRFYQRVRYHLRKIPAYSITHPLMPTPRKLLRVLFGISWRVPRIPSMRTVARRSLKSYIKKL